MNYSVSSADSTSFVYDPLELKLVGNHQVFYVENTNWLSQISVKDISIAALYTDSEGGITSLGREGNAHVVRLCLLGTMILLLFNGDVRVRPSQVQCDRCYQWRQSR